MLYFVPTPIGNLNDISYRAVSVLKSADLILAEDTRVSGKLLKHFEIDTPMRAYHQHNEHLQTQNVINDLNQGKTLALITDAGTPGISDPGFLLAQAAIENNIKFECLPGATAFVPALVLSGFPNHRFSFEGFLPTKKGRQKKLKFLAEQDQTFILYESPHRLLKTLDELKVHLGEEREVAVIKELTKLHEQCLRAPLANIQQIIQDNMTIKGEYVLVISAK